MILKLLAIMILNLKMLAPLAAVSAAYAIPASLRGARTGRAPTEGTPEIAGMDAATQRDLVDRILRDPSSARDVVASALGLEPSAPGRRLGALGLEPCAIISAVCSELKFEGPICDFASSSGCDDIVAPITKFVLGEQSEEASRDDAEADAEAITLPMPPAVPAIIDINLPGGVSFKAGVNIELGEGSQPGSISGKVEGGVEGGIDPAQNILGFGIGGGLSAIAEGESGIDGELGMGGVGLDAYTEGSSGAGMKGDAALLGASTTVESVAKMEGSSTFNATANAMGASVGGAAKGSSVAGAMGNTNAFGMDVLGGHSASESNGEFSSENALAIVNGTVSTSVVNKATGKVGVGGSATLMNQTQALDASAEVVAHSDVKNAVSLAGVSSVVDVKANGTLTFEGEGPLINGTQVINVPIVDFDFNVTIP